MRGRRRRLRASARRLREETLRGVLRRERTRTRKRFPFVVDADGSWPAWIGAALAVLYGVFLVLDWALLLYIATVGPIAVLRTIKRPALELTVEGIRLMRADDGRTIPWADVVSFESKGHYLAFQEALPDGRTTKHAFTGVPPAHQFRAASLIRAQVTARAFD